MNRPNCHVHVFIMVSMLGKVFIFYYSCAFLDLTVLSCDMIIFTLFLKVYIVAIEVKYYNVQQIFGFRVPGCFNNTLYIKGYPSMYSMTMYFQIKMSQ